MTGGLEVAARAVEGGHAALLQAACQRLALSPCQAARGVGSSRVVGSSLGQADPAAAEKGVDAFEPRPSVEVRAVVGVAVEGDELPAGLVAQTQQELVEDLTPGPGVEQGAVGEDPLQVEETCADVLQAGRASSWSAASVRATAPAGPRARRARPASSSAVCCRSRASLRRRCTSSEGGSDVARGAQRPLGGIERQLPRAS